MAQGGLWRSPPTPLSSSSSRSLPNRPPSASLRVPAAGAYVHLAPGSGLHADQTGGLPASFQVGSSVCSRGPAVAAALLASFACYRPPAGRRNAASQPRRTARCARTKVRLTDGVPKDTDFYGLLGVDRDATQDDIRAAYKKVIRETHPDVNPSADAGMRFIQVQEAFRWLSDPMQREVYDGVGGQFGTDALYDYTDEPILGTLNAIERIEELQTGIEMVNVCRRILVKHPKHHVKLDMKIKDVRQRYRKWGAQRTMWVRDYFCRKLRAVLAYTHERRKLHPFERLAVETTLYNHQGKTGVPFSRLLGAIKELRKRLHETAAVTAHACKTCESGRLASRLMDDCVKNMYEMVISHEPVIHQFKEAQREMKKAPKIDLDKPTIVFVGAPNVGKSSLVCSLSTGNPEVNNYAFTTRSISVGHIWHFIAGTPLLVHGQIMDSPGLRRLPGSGGDHNLMEELTLGAMVHLPTGVVYVFDPYPFEGGFLTVDEQIELRNQLKAKFPKRPWLDVITKLDHESPDAQEGIKYLSKFFPDAIKTSCMTGDGLDELNMGLRTMLEEMTKVLRQLQRTKLRQLRMGDTDVDATPLGKEALVMR